MDHTAWPPCLQRSGLAFPLDISGDLAGHNPVQGNQALVVDRLKALAVTADCMGRLFHMADPSFFPSGPWNQEAGHGNREQNKKNKKINQMITAQHRKSSHQILQVSSKCPHTDNCTITAVKYLTAESYISIPEKKKEKKKKLQQTGKLCFSPHLISHGHYPDFFFTSLCHSFGSQQNIYTLSNGGQSAQS